jgi:predicted nucleotidyltransferase
MDQNQIRKRIKETIHNKDPKAIAFLFGSPACGDFRPDSDRDILILVDSNKLQTKLKISLETAYLTLRSVQDR